MDKTIRQELFEYLLIEFMTIKKIKTIFKFETYKEAENALIHVFKSSKAKGYKIKIISAQCSSCQYMFDNRKKLTKPSRCPKCKKENVYEAQYKLYEK